MQAAQSEFVQGITLSTVTGVQEFTPWLLLNLALALENQGAYDKAIQTYEQAAQLAAARPAALRAQVEAQQALIRLHLEGPKLLWWHLLPLAALLLFLGYLLGKHAKPYQFTWSFRRNKTLSFPKEVITKPRKRKSTSLFDRRINYLRLVLTQPEEVAEPIAEILPDLAKRLTKLEYNHELFSCIAALEEVNEGTTFENDPANSIASYLRKEFKRRTWPWPLDLTAWRQWVQARDVE